MIEIKICGLTNVDDARWALEEGADYLGFVLYSKSPRCVGYDDLNRIADSLPPEANLVGVFVDEAPILVKNVAEACRLEAVQLHGNEEPGDFDHFIVPVWRAVRFRNGVWIPDPGRWDPDRYVMDADTPQFGGAGARTDWDAAAGFSREHHAMLAGGLTPGNVAEAIRRVRPMGVDVSSGVETEPGKKDLKKVAAFIRAVRQVEQDLGL